VNIRFQRVAVDHQLKGVFLLHFAPLGIGVSEGILDSGGGVAVGSLDCERRIA
jgi:hypothetical protein